MMRTVSFEADYPRCRGNGRRIRHGRFGGYQSRSLLRRFAADRRARWRRWPDGNCWSGAPIALCGFAAAEGPAKFCGRLGAAALPRQPAKKDGSQRRMTTSAQARTERLAYQSLLRPCPRDCTWNRQIRRSGLARVPLQQVYLHEPGRYWVGIPAAAAGPHFQPMILVPTPALVSATVRAWSV